jgi:hypothetical protein
VASAVNLRPYRAVLNRVDEVRGQLRALALAEGVLAEVAVTVLAILLATAIQSYAHFGQTGRWVLLGGILASFLAGGWWFIVAALRSQPNDLQVARLIETRIPILGNNLINTIQLAEDSGRWSEVLVSRAIVEAAAGTVGVDLFAAVSTRRRNRWAMAAGGAVVLLAVFAVVQGDRFWAAAHQILTPASYVPSVGAVRLTGVTPGDIECKRGDALDIEVAIAPAAGGPFDGFIEITEPPGGPTVRKPLVRDESSPTHFTYRVPKVLQPLSYRVNIAGTESKVFQVTLAQVPMIEKIDLVYRYPEYTGLAPETVENSGGNIRCLVGTSVEVRIHLSAKSKGGTLLFSGGGTRPSVPDQAGLVLAAQFQVLQDDTYQIRLDGQPADGAAVVYKVAALPDEPPTIQFTMPGRDVVAGPGDTVKMVLKAGDAIGLGEVRILAQVDGQGTPRTVVTWKKFTDPKGAELDHAFLVDPTECKIGQTITYWAEATDRLTYQGGATSRGPNLATTGKFKIAVEDRKAAAEKKIASLSRLFDRLREILKAQREARAACDSVASAADLASVRGGGAGLGKVQKAVRDDTLALSREDIFDSDTVRIKVVLEVLAANEMASSSEKARSLADLADPPGLAGAPALAKALAADQDAIIAVLERILDITGKLADAVKASEKRLDPSDLPPDELAKLNALRERLKGFLAEQKKVIEASKDLAKKPADDFQETDQRELEKLKAIEDQWDKFLNEVIADFSKIPDVDASNPSLIKELIEVKTDVEMAADALSKKAADLAVPLEELGMEAAKEIVENLERWLPDTPDRLAWKQEEFSGDVEIPHAELPQQMEDLVGELLEQEEDLFEEMQDTTSGGADSADKGAGWDAMDGPISNFSAKGVTGNQLPNSSEISGRSGEGRSGKASGEFVEEEAAGKGGRRTPTRLTPEPFSKGDIKDSSPEAPGGATGGGKTSGAGNEGLEGPVPPDIQRRMGSLAGKQAQIRNKAEGVKAALAVKNYDSFALQQAIDGMRRVQRDILAGRYSSALRQKDVIVDNLKDTRMLLGGEVKIRQDASPSVPNEVRTDVLDALDKPMPQGYEEYLKKYYERLSEGK